jgi:hypothetical protein
LEAEADSLRNDIKSKEYTIKNKEKDREVKRQAIRNEEAEQSAQIAEMNANLDNQKEMIDDMQNHYN